MIGVVVGLLLGHRLPLTMYSKFGTANHLHGWVAGALWGTLLGATAAAARSGSARKFGAGALLLAICVTATLFEPR